MSKLRYIVGNLQARDDVKILEHLVPKDPVNNLKEFYNVFLEVAPTEGLYTAEELQEFMMGLISPNMKPECQDDFEEFEGTLFFGKLQFAESIGTIEKIRVTTLKSSDKELLEKYNFSGTKVVEDTINGDFMRYIHVGVFPSEEVRNDIEEGKLKKIRYNGIPLKLLRQYKNPSPKGLLQRLFRK